MGTYWVEFDNLYMKQKLIHGWPHVKEEHDHKITKTIAIVALILGVLYSFVKFGPTGDLSKTWTADDIPKATAYPK